MKISNAFPSKFLKCADLQGRTVTVKMHRVEIEDIGDDKRPVVYFHGKEKGLVLNKTNANTIVDMYGDDTDSWEGHSITLRPTRVDFRGDRVDAIRIEFHQPEVKQQTSTRATPNKAAVGQYDERNPPPTLEAEMNDEIPW